MIQIYQLRDIYKCYIVICKQRSILNVSMNHYLLGVSYFTSERLSEQENSGVSFKPYKKRWRRWLSSSKPEDVVIQNQGLERYEEHGRFSDVLTNDSHDNLSIKVTKCIMTTHTLYSVIDLCFKTDLRCPSERYGSYLLHIQILWTHREYRQGFVGEY